MGSTLRINLQELIDSQSTIRTNMQIARRVKDYGRLCELLQESIEVDELIKIEMSAE